MKPLRLLFAAPFLASLALAGCAAPDGTDDADATSAAASSNPIYDAVVRNGTKVETDTTRNAEQSARTHLVGFVRGAQPERILDRLLSVGRWTEIRDADGEQPFTRAELVSDTSAGGTRTVVAKLTLDGGVTLDVQATAKDGEDGIEVRMTNTSAYRHWLIGTVLEANKLTIAFDLVPYEGGVIVDATMRAKLKKKEERAAELTGSVRVIFDWLARR